MKWWETNFLTFLSGGRCEITDISHRPYISRGHKNCWKNYMSIVFRVLTPNILGEYRRKLQELVQECIPGSLPGARSWRYSRNAFLGCVQEREIWKLKSYLKLHGMARNKFWDFFIRGSVWNNRHFPSPLHLQRTQKLLKKGNTWLLF